MGVYIPNMEMPRNCLACDWCAHTIPADNYICYRLNRAVIGVAEEDVNETVNACCPIVPVPEHGRLGDLDELHKEAVRRSEKAGTYDSWYNCTDRVISAFDIENAPTIIPAEEGE